ncbi:MAG: LysR family transcriptional regulator [Firmicutes bacterium]|nr:LysR family transcriptional regulator [Bacillota bacterium]
MHIESLRYFRDIVEAKSISKVAGQSHISQSALSQLLQKMEDGFGYKLLKRSNKGVEPTEMGQVVYKYSENILKNYEKMLQDLRDLERRNDMVRINGSWSLVTYSLPCILYKVKQKFNNHSYELISSSTENTVRDVRNDICDFGIIYGKPKDAKEIFYDKLGREEIVLVASSDYKIPDKIKLEEILNYDLIMLTNGSNLYANLFDALKNIGKTEDDLNVIFNIDSIGAIKSSVHNCFGISLLPYMSVKKELYEKTYKKIEIEGLDLDKDIYIISKKMEKLNDSVKESIEFFLDMGEKGFC